MGDRSNDAKILSTFNTHPDWFADYVLSHLVGWPDPVACWEWPRARTKGYGAVRLPKAASSATVLVHRAVWLHERGPIPAGLVIDHGGSGCGNILCSNPNHLAAVTRQFNNVVTGTCPSAVNARKTHCPRGHALTEENLMPSQLAHGYRSCLTCARDHDAAIRRARMALGLGHDEYIRLYGRSKGVALANIKGAAA